MSLSARVKSWITVQAKRGAVASGGSRPAWVHRYIDELGEDRSDDVVRSGLDPVMHRALAHLAAKGFRPKAVADIGAAKGYWSLGAGTLFTEAAFYMFDPLKESESALKDAADRHQRYHYFLCALGDQPGTHTINKTSDCDGSSLLDYYEDNGTPTEQIRVETLDGMVADGKMPSPDLVKIDVQGFEMKVIDGGEQALRAAEVVIIEANMFRFMPECPLAHEVMARMAGLGFQLFDLAGELRRPFENDLGQLDLVLVRSDSPLVGSSRWA